MQVFCRSSTGKDPLGDVVTTMFATRAQSEEDAVKKMWDPAIRWNRGVKNEKNKIVTLHCGDTLLDVKTGKLRSLTGKLKGTVTPQPDLDMPSTKEPRLF